MTPKMHDLKLRESILKFKPTVLQVQVIEFSIMEPPAIKKRGGRAGVRGEPLLQSKDRTAINTKQLNTLTSTAMEGLQTNHHMPCELDIDGKPLASEIYFNRLPLSPPLQRARKQEKKKKKESTALRAGHIQLPQPPNVKPFSF